jgi:hypothetical protein
MVTCGDTGRPLAAMRSLYGFVAGLEKFLIGIARARKGWIIRIAIFTNLQT